MPTQEFVATRRSNYPALHPDSCTEMFLRPNHTLIKWLRQTTFKGEIKETELPASDRMPRGKEVKQGHVNVCSALMHRHTWKGCARRFTYAHCPSKAQAHNQDQSLLVPTRQSIS